MKSVVVADTSRNQYRENRTKARLAAHHANRPITPLKVSSLC
jgi:hypothetical protein